MSRCPILSDAEVARLLCSKDPAVQRLAEWYDERKATSRRCAAAYRQKPGVREKRKAYYQQERVKHRHKLLEWAREEARKRGVRTEDVLREAGAET